MRRLTLFLIFAAVLSPWAAFAQTPATPAAGTPIFSLQRASLAAGSDYAWYAGTNQAAPLPFAHEFRAGLFAAYQLVAPKPGERGARLSLVASTNYGLDTKTVFTTLGLRLVIFRGADSTLPAVTP